jgi:uncharacterized protein
MNIMYSKLDKLRQYLRKFNNMAIAFSSGVDSTFLLHVAHEELGDRVIAITASSAFYPERETEDAGVFTASRGIRHIICAIDELNIAGFAENPVNRCYLCKKSLFGHFKKVAGEHGIEHLAEGSNTDDEGDYRPGLHAIKELGILSPLREAGLTKAEIRQLSREMSLPTWEKPSLACLASRIPYGEVITRQKLKTIETSEQLLFKLGFKQARVRHHGTLARIEVEPGELQKIISPEIKDVICTELKKAGFSYVTLDLQGYRTGSMNLTIVNSDN